MELCADDTALPYQWILLKLWKQIFLFDENLLRSVPQEKLEMKILSGPEVFKDDSLVVSPNYFLNQSSLFWPAPSMLSEELEVQLSMEKRKRPLCVSV